MRYFAALIASLHAFSPCFEIKSAGSISLGISIALTFISKSRAIFAALTEAKNPALS